MIAYYDTVNGEKLNPLKELFEFVLKFVQNFFFITFYKQNNNIGICALYWPLKKSKTMEVFTTVFKP